MMVLAIILTATVKATDVAPNSEGMEMDAQTWCRSVKMGWNLGNAFESCGANWDDATGTWKDTWVKDYNEWETGWGNPKTTLQMIQAVKAEGFNAIRVPVRWVPHITDYNTMAVDPVWMARVRQVVDWCMDEGLMVVLNTHHELWLEYHPYYSEQKELQRKLKALWTNIATEFRDYDGRLAFSGTNEVNVNWQPPTAENLAVQNGFNQDFVDAVRATGGKNYYRNLIVQTYSCNPTYGLDGLTVPDDPVKGRLSIEFHYYTPWNYCNGGEGCYYYWGNAYKDKGTVTPDGNERNLSISFTQIRKKWWEQGLGVVMGEYGVANHYTADDQTTQEENEQYYLKCVVSEARKNGFAAFIWDNNAKGNGEDRFAVFDRNNGMKVCAPHLLNGVKAGSATEYSEQIDEPEQKDWGANGTIYWEGNGYLNWGTGLQLHIPAKEFSDFTEESMVVLYYQQDGSASYEDIQICNSSWGGLAFSVEEVDFTGDFSPRNYYSTMSESHNTPLMFPTASLAALKAGGMIIQGYGVTLTKVVFTDKNTVGITAVKNDCAAGRIYSLKGDIVVNPQAGHIYVSNGRKIVWIQ